METVTLTIDGRSITVPKGTSVLQASIEAGIIEPQPVDPLAHMILGSFNEAALLIAHAADKKAARREVSEVTSRLWNGLRVND